MVLSDANNDHACGLIEVLEHFNLKNLRMNRAWDYIDEILDELHGSYTREGLIKKMREMHPYLVEMAKMAERKASPSKRLAGCPLGRSPSRTQPGAIRQPHS